MVLATFSQNNKEYIYFFKEGKIEYGYRVNEKIYTNLTTEERNLMDKVYNKFMISTNKENHRKCGTINHNGKKYQILYDKISKRKFFLEIKENSYTMPDFKTYLYLDSYFNPEYVCDIFDEISSLEANLDKISKLENQLEARLDEISNLEEQTQKLYEKNQKLNKVCVRLNITIAAMTLLFVSSLYFHKDISKIDELQAQNISKEIEIETENFDVEKNEQKTIEDLKEALNSNVNLSSAEKEFVLQHFPFIEENQEYLDLNLIYERLSTLTISYHQEENGNIWGSYTNNNTIICYSCSSFEEAITNHKNIIDHELYHVFTARFVSLGDKTYEALNEIMTQEYEIKDLIGCGGVAYSKELAVVYPLIEVLGSEICREAYCKDDPEILVNGLKEIIDDENKAYELLGMIDNLDLEYQDLKENSPSLTPNEIKSILYPPINEEINAYFIAKYGYDMMEDEIMQNYLLAQEIDSFQPKDSIAGSMLDNFVNQKFEYGIWNAVTVCYPYFSKEYQNTKFPDGLKQIIQLYYFKTEGFELQDPFIYEVIKEERQITKTR